MDDHAQAPRPPLRALAERCHFAIGAAVATQPFLNGEPDYCALLAREFNVLVAENMMKWDALSPAPEQYDWSASDALVAFAARHAQRLRGHTLVWHNQLPAWLRERSLSRAEALRLLETHIKTVVGRYRGQVWAWDVVNEAIDDSGDYRRTSFWFRHLGPDYLALAFQWAHEADPDALLYYNDYSAEGISPKSDAIYRLLRDLKAQGVPIHGVGWQMHLIEGWRLEDQHRRNAERLRALGLELSITEMDVRLKLPPDAAQLDGQAESYRQALSFALDHCRALLTWGFSDRYSWIPSFQPGTGAALPFDETYAPKPAYHALWQTLAARVGQLHA